jgi:hypothetical protein
MLHAAGYVLGSEVLQAVGCMGSCYSEAGYILLFLSENPSNRFKRHPIQKRLYNRFVTPAISTKSFHDVKIGDEIIPHF